MSPTDRLSQLADKVTSRGKRRGNLNGAARRPSSTSFSHVNLPAWLATDDLLVCAIFAIAPLIMGGRSELGRAVYVLLVGALFIHWTISGWKSDNVRWVSTGVGWLLAAGLVLVSIQIMPLRGEWLLRISPKLSELLPCWGWESGSVFRLGQWDRISLDPHATLFALVVYAAHACLFIMLVQRLKTTHDVQKMLRILAGSTVFIAVVATIQYLSGTDNFVWVFQHPSREAHRALSGPFENGNHFAHLLALGIAPLIWWLHSTMGPAKRGPTGNRLAVRSPMIHQTSLLLCVAIGVVTFAALLSRSRGGVLMIFLATSICCGGSIRLGAMPRRAIGALAAAGLIVVAALFVYGSDIVSNELSTLTSGSMEDLDHDHARRRIWQANLEVNRFFPLLGTGVGSHAEVYKLFYSHPSRVEYTHAESGYINLLTETGWIGCGLFLLAAGSCITWLWRAIRIGSEQRQLLTVIVISGIAVSLIHSIFDFPWYLTSCMSFTIALCACARQLGREEKAGNQTLVQPGVLRFWSVLGSAAFIGAVAVISGPTIGSIYFDKYLAMSLRAKRASSREGLVQQQFGKLTAQGKTDFELHQEMMEALGHTLRWDPNHPLANLRLASGLLSSFEFLQQFNTNSMSLSQIRDASVASQFETDAARSRWLQAAVGQNLQLLLHAQVYAYRGLTWSPLEGRAYLHLAELGFMQNMSHDAANALRRQAESVRPHDAAIMFAAGTQAALSANVEKALEYWKRAYHHDEDYRKPIMQALGTRLPAAFFVEYFQPNRRDLSMLYTFYMEQQLTDQAHALAPTFVAALESEAGQNTGIDAAGLLMQAVAIRRALGDGDGAVTNARLAVTRAPNQYNPHRVLAQQLMIEAKYDEAIEQLSWCVRARPSDGKLKQVLNSAKVLRRRERGLPVRVVSQPAASNR